MGRSSSLNITDSGISREIGSNYALVLEVGRNIDAVIKAASVDLPALADAIGQATDFEGISVVPGSVAGWDPVTKTITVPSVKGDKGDTGNPLGLTSITYDGNGVFTWAFTDGTSYQTPSLKGNQGDKGDKGDKGDFTQIVSVTDVGNGRFTWLFSDGTSYTTPTLTGAQGDKGDKGDKGDVGSNLTVEQIVSNPDGTFIWQFSDGTTYTTPNLKGPQGSKGDQGNKGDQGVSVHHLRPTSTTDPEGDYGTFGELDTYTFYGDADETMVLGWFTTRNGIGPDQLEPLGLMRTTTYDTDYSGVVDNSERLEGASLSDVQSFVTARTGDTSLLTTVATNLTGGVNELDSSIGDLSGLNTPAPNVVGAINTLDTEIGNVYNELTGSISDVVDTFSTEIGNIPALSTVSTNLVGAINELDDTKYDKTGGTVSGSVTINGDLSVNGTVFTVNTEEVLVTDNILVLNDGEVGTGVTSGFAGIKIDRGTEIDYEFGFNETTELFEVGKVGDHQPLLTRMLAPVANKFFRWNNTTKQAETADITWGDVTGKLSDVSKTEAETGTGTTPRFWSSLRVREAILGWWNSSASKTKLDGVETGAQVNSVTSVAGKTGAVTLAKSDVGLSNVDNAQQAPITRVITAGTGLIGGGDLTADRTLSVSYGTTTGTAAQGDDSRLSNSREWTAVTIGQTEAEAGTSTTRRAFTAQRVRQAIVAWFNGISGALGRTILSRTTAAQVRADIGLGAAATYNVATDAEALAGTAGVLPDAAGVHAAFDQYGLGGVANLRSSVYSTGTPSDLYSKGTAFGFADGQQLGIPGFSTGNYGTLEVGNQWGDASGLASVYRRFTAGASGYSREFLQVALSDTTWGAWVEFYHTGNFPVIGTATETEAGVVELATAGEVQAGIDTTRVITPAGLASRTATESRTGLVELATTGEAKAGSDTSRAVTSAGVKSYVDQYGVGVTVLDPVADLDTLTVSGIYRCNNTTANRPLGGMDYCTVTHSVRSPSEMTQVAISVTGVTRVAIRSMVGSLWSAWEYMNPTLGTVSQSGGIPTGAIIQRGSNASGSYVMFADGTIIFWLYVNASYAITTANTISGFINSSFLTWTYPVPLAAVGAVKGHGTQLSCNVVIESTSLSSARYRLTSHSSSETLSRSYFLEGIGRWY